MAKPLIQKVWIVLEQDFGGWWVEGVFSTKEKAEKYVSSTYDEYERKYVIVKGWEVK